MQANKFRSLGSVETMALAASCLKRAYAGWIAFAFAFAAIAERRGHAQLQLFSNHRRAERHFTACETRRGRRVARLYMHGIGSSFHTGSSFCTS